MSFKVWHIPLRLATGAYILESGISKLGAEEGTAGKLRDFAAGTYAPLGKVKPQQFLRLLSASEIALGAAVLVPMIPTALAGVGLAAFSAGLIGLYVKTPGMRREGSLRPTQQGLPLAKDVWMLGIGAALVIDGLTP